MRNRHRHSTNPVDQLRLAIDCLPVATREAMLVGVRANERILVGAYVDAQGGVCPMLAAHRCGGRTDFLSFAKSWDRFTRARGRGRRATSREVSILLAELEDSIESASGTGFDEVIREHRELRRRTRALRGGASGRLIQVDPEGEISARRLRRPSRLRRLGDKLAEAPERRLVAPVAAGR